MCQRRYKRGKYSRFELPLDRINVKTYAIQLNITNCLPISFTGLLLFFESYGVCQNVH